MQANKDINWINAVKAISIIAVFLVHCQLYYGYVFNIVNDYIHPFYVNAFFFVSGYLLFRKQLTAPIIKENISGYIRGGGKAFLLNIIFRLMIPSTLFAIIEFLPKTFLKGQELGISGFLWETIGGRTYWFTSALVVAQIIILLILITRCRKIWLYWIISLLCMTLGMVMADRSINFLNLLQDPWQFKHGLYSLPFLTAGGLYWRYEKQIQQIMKKWVIILLSVIYIIIFWIWRDELHVLVSMLDVNWSGYLAGCFASILLIEICRYLPAIKVLTFIGRNSISFYFMSGGLPIVISLIVNRLYGVPSWSGLIIVWLTTVVLAYAITYILNIYMPWVFDLRRLKRHLRESSYNI